MFCAISVSRSRVIAVSSLILMEKVENWKGLKKGIRSHRTLLNYQPGMSGLLQLDAQNRIKLNPMLKKRCQIERDVLVVGSIRYMQIYDPRVYEEMLDKEMELYDAASDDVSKEGE